jgi:hypothetical protein
MEAECFENIVSVPAGVRLAIVLCHRYQLLLGGQPAARGASGTVPLFSKSTGRVVDIMSSLARLPGEGLPGLPRDCPVGSSHDIRLCPSDTTHSRLTGLFVKGSQQGAYWGEDRGE